jgi:DNA-binding response OmpR family regulator
MLLVEDDENDAFFFKRALTQARPDLPLTVVTDGQQAVDYLDGNLDYSNRAVYPLPSIVLLDLKLPYLSGFQVLEHIKARTGLSQIPVYILTSSGQESDRNRARELGAAGYFVKPPTPEVLLHILQSTPGRENLPSI